MIIICGATATGKSDLAVYAAQRLNGEIISADSMQIYKYMNIGTAKVTVDEMQGIPHYMIDIVEPNQSYSVAEFQESAVKIIDDIYSRGKTPIVVGGTGLYINSLIYGSPAGESYEVTCTPSGFSISIVRHSDKSEKKYTSKSFGPQEQNAIIKLSMKGRINNLLKTFFI